MNSCELWPGKKNCTRISVSGGSLRDAVYWRSDLHQPCGTRREPTRRSRSRDRIDCRHSIPGRRVKLASTVMWPLPLCGPATAATARPISAATEAIRLYDDWKPGFKMEIRVDAGRLK
jgi:hypothetical protein